MKRSLTLMLASLMLVFALTACGRGNDTPQDSGQNGNQNESAVVGGESANGGSSNGSSNNGSNSSSQNGGNQNGGGNNATNGETNGGNGSLLEDAGNAVEDGLNGVENAVDDMTGGTAKSRAGGSGTMSR